ncbi:hypothetical protein ASE17_20520 [Phenylobacterium sp. Root77]|uniref:hypothetical protein n=1 Tax=unclassified Phenylobacterium TaxID=2640670 RepID=UPI0006FB346D|nr:MULTISPECIES: hypothetical protein [unclassified Phenylobacterium]KRC43581.1 hypothetical protein ASE17_20520 [Phenylobacterium sp. Root77]
MVAGGALDDLPTEVADAAGDEGYLRGNSRYADHRGWLWDDVRDALKVEAAVVDQIAAVPVSAEAEAAFEAQRDLDSEGAEALWGLDVGVASAVIALSALRAMPFISCNAGSFGGVHAASRPYVAFYIAEASPDLLLALAERAGVGLEVQDGVLCLYGRTILDLMQFASVAEAQSRSSDKFLRVGST